MPCDVTHSDPLCKVVMVMNRCRVDGKLSILSGLITFSQKRGIFSPRHTSSIKIQSALMAYQSQSMLFSLDAITIHGQLSKLLWLPPKGEETSSIFIWNYVPYTETAIRQAGKSLWLVGSRFYAHYCVPATFRANSHSVHRNNNKIYWHCMMRIPNKNLILIGAVLAVPDAILAGHEDTRRKLSLKRR